MNLNINDILSTIKNIFSQIQNQRLVFDFSICLLIQGGCPCLGTDKTRASNTCWALVLHQRSLQSTFMLLQEWNYAMFLFIMEQRDGVKERGEEELGSDRDWRQVLLPPGQPLNKYKQAHLQPFKKGPFNALKKKKTFWAHFNFHSDLEVKQKRTKDDGSAWTHTHTHIPHPRTAFVRTFIGKLYHPAA